jgi:hypothetical protein
MGGTQRQRRVFEDLRDIDRDRDDQQTGERGRCADFSDKEIMPSFDTDCLDHDRAMPLLSRSVAIETA